MKAIRYAVVCGITAAVFAWGGISSEARPGDGHRGHDHAKKQTEAGTQDEVVCPTCKTVTKRVSYSKDVRKLAHLCPTCKTRTKLGDSDITEKVHVCKKCDEVIEQCPECAKKIKKLR